MKKCLIMGYQLSVISLTLICGVLLNSCSKLQSNNIMSPVSCNSCHGSLMNAAPPPDLAGNTSTSDPTVGAHQIHLAGSDFAAAVPCSSCHIVPKSIGPGIHPDAPGNSLIAFSGIAVTETNTPGSRFYDSTQPTVIPMPTFNTDSSSLRCSNTYCHGNFKGGNNFSPRWTVLDGTQDSCGSCHNLPPHGAINGVTAYYNGPSSQNCYFCHEPMMGPDGIQDSSLHANGKLELYNNSQAAW